LPPIAKAAPPPPAQQQHNANRSNHCQICKVEPEEPDAVDPEDADEPPGNEDPPLRLDPSFSEVKDDDDNDPKLLPEEPDEDAEESHAVHEDVVVGGGVGSGVDTFVGRGVVGRGVVGSGVVGRGVCPSEPTKRIKKATTRAMAIQASLKVF
jgi:hypothetical protein